MDKAEMGLVDRIDAIWNVVQRAEGEETPVTHSIAGVIQDKEETPLPKFGASVLLSVLPRSSPIVSRGNTGERNHFLGVNSRELIKIRGDTGGSRRPTARKRGLTRQSAGIGDNRRQRRFSLIALALRHVPSHASGRCRDGQTPSETADA